MTNSNNLKWINSIPSLIKEFKDLIDKTKKEFSGELEISLSTCLLRLEECQRAANAWGKIFFRLQNLERKATIEFKHWRAKKLVEFRRNVKEEADERKRTGLAQIPTRSQDYEAMLESTSEYKKYSMRLADVKCYIDIVGGQYFWPATKRIEVLREISKFTIASEKQYLRS